MIARTPADGAPQSSPARGGEPNHEDGTAVFEKDPAYAMDGPASTSEATETGDSTKLDRS
jgi:hypothetical protein